MYYLLIYTFTHSYWKELHSLVEFSLGHAIQLLISAEQVSTVIWDELSKVTKDKRDFSSEGRLFDEILGLCSRFHFLIFLVLWLDMILVTDYFKFKIFAVSITQLVIMTIKMFVHSLNLFLPQQSSYLIQGFIF